MNVFCVQSYNELISAVGELISAVGELSSQDFYLKVLYRKYIHECMKKLCYTIVREKKPIKATYVNCLSWKIFPHYYYTYD